MVNGIHDNGTYIKTYIRNANKTGIDQFEIHYTKLNSHKITIKNTKYLTSLEDISNTRFLVPIIECKGVSQELCDTIDKLVSDIEADLRNNISNFHNHKLN